jgi:hypothetical protein
MNELLDKNAIERIVELAKASSAAPVIKVDGDQYYDGKWHSLVRIEDHAPATIVLSTLSGFAEIIKKERKIYGTQLYVYPVSPTEVCAKTTLLGDLDRDLPYSAVTESPHFHFGHFMPIEELLIALRSRFVQRGDVDYLCDLLASVTNSEGIELQDDGMTQKVEVKKGVSLKQKAATRPIVKLAPYRTFTEIGQPDSNFLFRVKAFGNEVQATLFEADGGAWRNQAMRNIKEHLDSLFDGTAGVTVIA